MEDKKSTQKRALVITARRELTPGLKVVLNRHKVAIDTSYESLSSLLAITKSVRETGNTVFIRKAFSRFVNDWGLPDVLIIDDRIQLAVDSWQDPDTKKILRTFIVSIIIVQATAPEPRPVNVVLLDVTDGKSNSASFEKDPVRILDILGMDNAAISGVIASLRKNPGHFRSLMNIKVISASSERSQIESEMNSFLSTCFLASGSGAGPGEKKDEPGESAPVPGGTVQKTAETAESPAVMPADDVCDVVVRMDDDSCSVNGTLVDVNGDQSCRDFIMGEINITGRWLSRNQRKVHDVILREVNRGIAGKLYDDSTVMVINLTRCEIDQSIIASLISLATRELSRFKDVKILVNFKNATLLEKAPGYIMIRKQVYHAY